MGIATTFQDIYASIGYLFYSIAASDGKDRTRRKAEAEAADG